MNLTKRQCDLLRELLAGCCLESAAARLGIAVATAKFHRTRLYERIGVNSHAQLMARLMTPTEEARRLIE